MQNNITTLNDYLYQKLTTSHGDEFIVKIIGDEIIYLDCYGDSLTWDDNNFNREVVTNLIKIITL